MYCFSYAVNHNQILGLCNLLSYPLPLQYLSGSPDAYIFLEYGSLLDCHLWKQSWISSLFESAFVQVVNHLDVRSIGNVNFKSTFRIIRNGEMWDPALLFRPNHEYTAPGSCKWIVISSWLCGLNSTVHAASTFCLYGWYPQGLRQTEYRLKSRHVFYITSSSLPILVIAMQHMFRLCTWHTWFCVQILYFQDYY